MSILQGIFMLKAMLNKVVIRLDRKDDFSVIIIGMDGAGKSTLLEKIKTIYNKVPGLAPDKIRPTIGQNSKDRVVYTPP